MTNQLINPTKETVISSKKTARASGETPRRPMEVWSGAPCTTLTDGGHRRSSSLSEPLPDATADVRSSQGFTTRQSTRAERRGVVSVTRALT